MSSALEKPVIQSDEENPLKGYFKNKEIVARNSNVFRTVHQLNWMIRFRKKNGFEAYNAVIEMPSGFLIHEFKLLKFIKERYGKK